MILWIIILNLIFEEKPEGCLDVHLFRRHCYVFFSFWIFFYVRNLDYHRLVSVLQNSLDFFFRILLVFMQ